MRTQEGFIDCVPEYYREQEERYNHQMEIDDQRREDCEENKKRFEAILATGKPKCMEKCMGCPYAIDMGRQWYENSLSFDDMFNGYCDANDNSQCEFHEEDNPEISLREYILLPNAKFKIVYHGIDNKTGKCFTDTRFFKTKNDAEAYRNERMCIVESPDENGFNVNDYESDDDSELPF